ncbi:transposase [Streptomyces mirabilis]|uniref:transposase n=1 Tax=Streptomyces mirabilis TaxID=68239 RepID=UPI00331F0F3B
MTADGKGLVGHAGAVLLRRLADRVGLIDALAGVLPSGTASSWRDRTTALIGLVVAMALGATNLLEAEQLQLHHGPLFGPAVSDSTLHRLLSTTSETRREQIAKVRHRVRRHVWTRLLLRPGGFPYRRGAASEGLDRARHGRHGHHRGLQETGRHRPFKGTFGFHPLAAWLANTDECLAMELREGNAGANTVADHLRVLDAALAQIPRSSQAKILVRVDGAGATHGLLKRLQALNTARRTVRYTVGWTITPEDERAIARLPEAAWENSMSARASTGSRSAGSPATTSMRKSAGVAACVNG